jgi:ankyrin repeat protein
VVTAREINNPIYGNKASAIWWAVKNSNAELVRILLEGGGNPNSMNFENSTCLHEAMQNGDLGIIFMLLDYGGDLHLKNNRRLTPVSFTTPKMRKLLGLKERTVASQEKTGRDNLSSSMNISEDWRWL